MEEQSGTAAEHRFAVEEQGGTMQEHRGDGTSTSKICDAAKSDYKMLRLVRNGTFYASCRLLCLALHWPKLVAGAKSGELFHLEVQEVDCTDHLSQTKRYGSSTTLSAYELSSSSSNSDTWGIV